jgi:hypothetical protein
MFYHPSQILSEVPTFGATLIAGWISFLTLFTVYGEKTKKQLSVFIWLWIVTGAHILLSAPVIFNVLGAFVYFHR